MVGWVKQAADSEGLSLGPPCCLYLRLYNVSNFFSNYFISEVTYVTEESIFGECLWLTVQRAAHSLLNI